MAVIDANTAKRKRQYKDPLTNKIIQVEVTIRDDMLFNLLQELVGALSQRG